MTEGSSKILRTSCILIPRSPIDGIRISVMSRHTLNDGKTPDHRLMGMFDEHRPELGPAPKLIGDYYRGLSWAEFAEKILR